MSNDYGEKIRVNLKTSPVQLDKQSKISGDRFILGYLVMVYDIDQDAEVTIYYKRDASMAWESLDPITISKDQKRLYRKLPLSIGSVIDYYVDFDGDFEELEITTMKLKIKGKLVGKRS